VSNPETMAEAAARAVRQAEAGNISLVECMRRLVAVVSELERREHLARAADAYRANVECEA